jgi:uncharacterized protein
MKHLFLAATLGLMAFAGTARGDIVTQWDFNFGSDGNTSTGTLTPVIGNGTAQLVGGTTGSFASGDASGGSTDPNVGDDSAWNLTTWAPQGTGNKERGAQFNVSTLGVTQGIVISFDQRLSNTDVQHLAIPISAWTASPSSMATQFTIHSGCHGHR